MREFKELRSLEGGERLRQVQVPEGVQGLPTGVVYGLEWITVRLPVLYRGEGEDWSGGGVAQGGGAGAQGPPPARVGREVERQALDPGAGGEGDFKYVIVDGKYVKLR